MGAPLPPAGRGDVVGQDGERDALPQAHGARRCAPTTCSCSSATRRWSSRKPHGSTTACTPTSRSSSRCTTRTAIGLRRMRHFHRHHRAQARRRSAARLGGELSGDLRRRRGRDLRARHRDRARSSTSTSGPARRSATRARSSGSSTSARLGSGEPAVHAGGCDGADRARRRRRGAADRMARPAQGRHAALARGIRASA